MDPLTASSFAAQREHQISWLRAQGDRYDGVVDPFPDKLLALRAAIDALGICQVQYALIGGLAVGIRSGVPRATLDVDLAIRSTTARQLVAAAFGRAGLELRGEFAHSLNFVHESGEPVQLAFDPGFDAMIARADDVALGDLTVRVVTTEDLIAMKRRAAADPGRRRSKALRDQADIALLEGDVPGPHEGW
jgi:hypothetical protein